MLVQLQEHLAAECFNCIDVAVFVMADVIIIPPCTAAPDDLSITVMLMPPVLSSVLQPHLSTSRPAISDAGYSPRVDSELTIGFQKARLVFSLPFPFLSTTSNSTLPLTSGLLTVSDSLFAMCENVSICMTGRRRLQVGYRSKTCHHTCMQWWGWKGFLWLHSLRSSEGRVGRVQLCDSAMGACLCQNILV